MEYNGGAVLAMVGKDCVAIGSDKRLGAQAVTISNEFPKLFPMTSRTIVGLTGLATDVQTVSEQLRFRTNMYELQEQREIAPQAFANMLSSMLYEKRFGPYYVEPVVAGLEDKTGMPFICSMDVIGCINFAKDFVVGGVAAPNLYGICESLYQPNLEPEQLFETVSQSLLNAVDRDALSGWGAVVTIITPKKIITRTLRTRQD